MIAVGWLDNKAVNFISTSEYTKDTVKVIGIVTLIEPGEFVKRRENAFWELSAG